MFLINNSFTGFLNSGEIVMRLKIYGSKCIYAVIHSEKLILWQVRTKMRFQKWVTREISSLVTHTYAHRSTKCVASLKCRQTT